MERRRPSRSRIAGLIVAFALAPASGRADGLLDKAGALWDSVRWSSDPPTLTDVARMMDHIQNQILDEGTVVVKQPDVWSQARMTMFRKEFENTMKGELGNFTTILAAQIARSDYASFSSQTALGASLSPAVPGANFQLSPSDIAAERNAAVNFLNTSTSSTGGSAGPSSASSTSPTPALPGNPNFPATTANFSLLNAVTPAGNLTASTTGALPTASNLNFGLEPNIHLDEKADYITHLHRLRRVNLGDDNADSAGYGLYLMRIPVSIQPGDDTKKGFGAIVNISVTHDFSPRFLQSTYRNLVINDLVDILGPVIHELIRSGKAWDYKQELQKYWEAKGKRNQRDADFHETNWRRMERGLQYSTNFAPASRTGQRTYAIAPSDVRRVFVAQNLLNLAFAVQQALDLGNSGRPDTWRVRSTDVRNSLRHELESAYDLMEGRCREMPPLLQDVEYIEHLTDEVYCRKFEGPKGIRVDSEEELNAFYNLYESFTHRLPGNLRFRPIGVLCWGIAFQAGLLNRQLHEDMKQTKGADGFTCPPEVDSLFFYPPEPGAEAIHVFQEYTKARWPIITFALEPVTDQQNIEDAYTRRRDMQLAIAFALASGRVSFRQAMTYTRQLQYEAQTIALNQTVSAFAHGNDTFGWRFTPRYQTPPDESNIHAIANLLIRGGPGNNFQLDNSKIEPGLREQTAVVVMPSFVRGARLDVAGDWFRLHDPDERTIHTARSIELGRRINDTRQALEVACKFGNYRREDAERLYARLHQLEAMLPLQTQFIKVPYENTLGGFALFTQGETALVPELTGYEGIEFIDTSQPCDLIVYGKHFSIYETAVVVGGVSLPREGTSTIVTTDGSTVGNILNSSVRDKDGNLIMIGPDGKTPIPVKDNGSFDILSREVMRVRIPAKVQTARREDTQPVVELYVSTPNGISNRLQIPASPPQKPPTPTFKVPTSPAFTFIDTDLTIPINAHVTGSGTAAAALVFDAPGPFPPGLQIRIQPLIANPPAAIDLQLNFPMNNLLLPVTLTNVPLVQNKGYVLDKTQLDSLASQLFKLINNGNLSFVQANPVATSSVLIQATAQPADTMTSTNALSVRFAVSLTPPPTSSRQGPTAAQGAVAVAMPAAALTSGAGQAAAVRPRTGPTVAEPSADRPRPIALAGRVKDPLAKATAIDPAPPAELPPLPAGEATAFQLSQPPSPGGTGVPPGSPTPPGPLVPPAAPAPPVTPAIPAPGGATIPGTAHTSQTIVVMPQRAPTVNVSVPITNVPRTKHHLFNRRQATQMAPASPAASARGPLLERILGRP